MYIFNNSKWLQHRESFFSKDLAANTDALVLGFDNVNFPFLTIALGVVGCAAVAVAEKAVDWLRGLTKRF